MRNLLVAVFARPRRLTGLLPLLLALAGPAWAQFPTNPQNPNQPFDPTAPPLVVRPDTATVRKVSKQDRAAAAAADSARRTERLFGWRVTRPQKASLLALVPGGGQIYNRKYWKLPIVYGMVGGLGYWLSYQIRYYNYFNYASAHSSTDIAAAEGEIPNKDLRTQLAATALSNPNAITNGLNFARRTRDLVILLNALGYSLQILDAVVDAHLHDFDVSDNLSLNWQPTLLLVPGQAAPTTGLALTLRLK